MQVDELLNLIQASAFLGVKPVTLRKWDNEKKLVAVRIGPRRDRKYRLADLMNFIKTFEETKEPLHWQEYLRPSIAYNIILPYAEGTLFALKKYWRAGYDNLLLFGNTDNFYWCCDNKENIKLGRAVIDLYNKDKIVFNKNINIWSDFLDKTRDNSDDLFDRDLSKLSLSELLNKYSESIELSKEHAGLSFCIDGIDEIGVIELKKILMKTVDKKAYNKLYNIITAPSGQSVASERELDVLKLAFDIKNKKIKNDGKEKAIKEIEKKYWWLDMGWDNYVPDTNKIIRTHLEEVLSGKVNIAGRISEFENYSLKIKKEKEQILKENNLDKNSELLKLSEILDKFFVWHDWRKEIQMRNLYVQILLLKEIAKRTNTSFEILRWASPAEVLKIASKESIDLVEIYQRSCGFYFLYKNGLKKVLSGEDASKKWFQTHSLDVGSITDLQGIGACKGKSVGEVFIALSASEAMKIKPGNILVTSMTMPDYLPAMKKAAGIVTDEGGLTCHAAVISRELGIPCIVGTKYATRFLKNGQRVEVAASHGTVRLI